MDVDIGIRNCSDCKYYTLFKEGIFIMKCSTFMEGQEYCSTNLLPCMKFELRDEKYSLDSILGLM